MIRKISPAGVVTTLAGSGATGSADGTGSAASFNTPVGVAVDGNGNVYVAETVGNVVRKISPAGVVTTLAGSSASGYADGTGAAASFNIPAGLAVDANGNLYVADSRNHTIRKISPAGVVTTLAGSTTSGSADGTGSAASFKNPGAVALDAAGNVYVADMGNHMIRKITPAGAVTTLAGSTASGYVDGTGSAASFNGPYGIAVDAIGHVYVADTFNNAIRRISPAGVVITLAGSLTSGQADGTGSAASFKNPTGVAVDAGGSVYVSDANNNLIRKITPTRAPQ
ncbi:NHL repeat-containing protein [Cupriavidus basilensis]